MPAFADRFRVRTPASILKESDKKQIHEAGLEVMEIVGVRIHSKAARDSLRKAGAEVEESTGVVKFPADLTKSLISKVPQNIVLAGREKEFDLPLDARHCYYTTDGCGIGVWDQKTRTRRLSVLQDITNTAIISDWLPHLSIYEPMVVPSDIPQKTHVIVGMRESFNITRKHILSESTSTAEEAELQIKMASEVVGGHEELRKRHIMSAMVCTMSPLTLDGHATDAAMAWSRAKVPVHITGMAMMGVSSPATIPGNDSGDAGSFARFAGHLWFGRFQHGPSDRGDPVVFAGIARSVRCSGRDGKIRQDAIVWRYRMQRKDAGHAELA
jgi:trimethylamine--corrinoid protein Co-methyltransferase